MTSLESRITEFSQTFQLLEKEIGSLIVGMDDVVRRTLATVFAGGHVLLEGVPGLGKTLLVSSIAKALGLNFKRIQFTPDLMPSDITGTQMLSEDDLGKRRFIFKQGPVFANIVLADEINRATPKTQAALLEAMAERQVTVFDETHILPKPFFVLATQNPVELEGTYPLPEAQLDRFMVKLLVPSPSSAELKLILQRTTGATIPEVHSLMNSTMSGEIVERMKQLVREVVIAEPMYDVLVRMIAAVTPGNQYATEYTKRYIRFGPGPRGAQSVVLSAKVQALLESRINVSFEDIKAVFIPALRHRVLVNFQAEADRVMSDQILEQVRNAR